METKDNKDKQFMFSITKEGDSVVQTGSISERNYKSLYFGEYMEAIEYMTEEIKKFILLENDFKLLMIKTKERIATIEDWQNKLNKPCQSMRTDWGNPLCRIQGQCFILNENFACPEGRILKKIL